MFHLKKSTDSPSGAIAPLDQLHTNQPGHKRNILCRYGILEKTVKRNFLYSFRNLGGNKTAQKIILKYVLDLEKDNGLHIKSDYNKLWIDYLHCLISPDYPINAIVNRKLRIHYDKLKN